MDAAIGLPGQCQRKAQIGARNLPVIIVQHLRGLRIFGLRNLRQRHRQPGARAGIAQSYCITESGFCRGKAARVQIGIAHRQTAGGIVRIGSNSGLCLLHSACIFAARDFCLSRAGGYIGARSGIARTTGDQDRCHGGGEAECDLAHAGVGDVHRVLPLSLVRTDGGPRWPAIRVAEWCRETGRALRSPAIARCNCPACWRGAGGNGAVYPAAR